ncbi:hypothetical protein R4K89_11585 [Brachyspira intermedia]|uniref:hypothetical protein n=1 Tax=Brachyspira intermedia TaxID=84377 RepID=UPI003004EB1A
MLNNAEDELDTLLVHSGVPAVEIAINEYIEKYAMAEKITKYAKTFIDYIKERDMENNIAALSGNEAKLKELNKDIEKISDDLNKLKNPEDIIKKVNELQNITSNIKNIERNIEQNKVWLEDLINKLINIIEL